LAAIFYPRSNSVGRGYARLFRPMYAGANMGHPSREEGFVLCSSRSADEPQLCRSTTESTDFSILLHFFEESQPETALHDSRQARPCPKAFFGLVRMDRDSAIYGLEVERCAALTYIGVDVIADFTLNRDREAH
jgi:hypothetical protein